MSLMGGVLEQFSNGMIGIDDMVRTDITKYQDSPTSCDTLV